MRSLVHFHRSLAFATSDFQSLYFIYLALYSMYNIQFLNALFTTTQIQMNNMYRMENYLGTIVYMRYVHSIYYIKFNL